MPKELEEELMRLARKKHLTGERKNAYVYGTLKKIEKKKDEKKKRNQR